MCVRVPALLGWICVVCAVDHSDSTIPVFFKQIRRISTFQGGPVQCTVQTLSQESGPDSARAASKVAEQGSREKTGKGPAGWSGVVVCGCKGVER